MIGKKTAFITTLGSTGAVYWMSNNNIGNSVTLVKWNLQMEASLFSPLGDIREERQVIIDYSIHLTLGKASNTRVKHG
jgi:hypothetical protein